jgi:queuine tRNA-ribosyltransferase
MFIPSLTHEAGAVLTVSDWVSIDVKLASCDLSDLLLKPGIAVLKQLDCLKTYWDWPGELVLNALSLPNHSSGQCVIRSKYDGSILRFTYEEILALIRHLNPDYVALPAYLLSLTTQKFPDILEKCIEYSECDKPGQDALKGLMYTSSDQRTFLITDKKYAMDFSVMDDACACPACADGFTRAYFHHLYAHTPLLCQRWLVMHNQWMASQVLV